MIPKKGGEELVRVAVGYLKLHLEGSCGSQGGMIARCSSSKAEQTSPINNLKVTTDELPTISCEAIHP
jgi:hypothetical protein